MSQKNKQTTKSLTSEDLQKKVIQKMSGQIHKLAVNYLENQLKSQLEYLQPFFLEKIYNINLP